MCTNSRFTQKFADSIVSVLGCFDRVIFKGHLFPFTIQVYVNGHQWLSQQMLAHKIATKYEREYSTKTMCAFLFMNSSERTTNYAIRQDHFLATDD